MKYFDRLKALREDADISQKEMGKILSVSQRTISHWENGRNEPPYDALIKYALHFNVSSDYILGLTDKLR